MAQDDSLNNPSFCTPATPVVVELAGLRRRLAGMLYELVLIFGLLAIGYFLPWMLLFSQLDLKAPPVWMKWFQWLHLLTLLGAYFVYSWHRHGQTLAMRTWRLRVVATNGSRLSWARATLRYMLALPSVLCFGIGILWAFFDLDNLFLHDRLAGTRVVRLPKPAPTA